jgi:hypothetical protein
MFRENLNFYTFTRQTGLLIITICLYEKKCSYNYYQDKDYQLTLINMKKILFVSLVSILILVSTTLSAQNDSAKKITGSWLGKLTVNGTDLRVVFNLKLAVKDSLTFTLDSPDQGAKDIPGGLVTLDKKNLVLKAPSINGEYNGIVTGDSTIEGNWTQNGGTLPLNLKKQGKQK